MKISPIPLAVRTTCAYCGVGCGVQATPQSGGGVVIGGDPSHPANHGTLCVKGSALGETLGLEGRLLHPRLRGEGGMRQASWDEALERVATGFGDIIAEHGAGAVALYVSGQLLTEDYYVANKLMKGYIGTANIDTNSRLCMSSSVAGHKRAFGADVVPGCYEDFDLADMVVLAGSNAAWCHPVLFQRIARLKERRPEVMVVVIDPRRTATCELADLHLPVNGDAPNDAGTEDQERAVVIPASVQASVPEGVSLETYMDQIERDAIQKALEKTQQNKTAAAKLLGITFRALRYRLKRLGLE